MLIFLQYFFLEYDLCSKIQTLDFEAVPMDNIYAAIGFRSSFSFKDMTFETGWRNKKALSLPQFFSSMNTKLQVFGF